MMRIILITILIICLQFVNQSRAADNKSLTGPDEYRAPELNDSSSLEDYLLFALASSPALEASYQRWQAAVQMAPQAGALPNPQLRYGYVLRRMDSSMPAEIQSFGISQEFPWFGKLSLSESIAVKAAQSAGREFDADRVELCRKVSMAYYDYWLLGRRIEITRSNLSLLKQTEQILNSRYSTGSGGFSQLLKVQVEMGMLEDGIVTLEKLASSRAAEFNALLGRDTGLPLPFPAAIDTLYNVQSPAELEQLLLERNPELARLRELQESAGDGVRLASKQRWPNMMIELDYTQTEPSLMGGSSGRDPVMAGISLELPLSFGRYDAAEKQAASNLSSLRQQEMDLTNMLNARLKQALVDLDDANRKVNLYGSTLVPKAEQSLGASITALAAGATDAVDVLDAQRTLLNFQLELDRSLAARVKSLAEIEALTGEILETYPAGQADPGDGK